MRKTVLVSACLLGQSCRYDGKSKPHADVQKLLTCCHVVPVCPEIMGGLATPRPPAERCGEKVINRVGTDVTEQYCRGGEETLRLAKLFGCDTAILKERSPSCGSGEIYDGTFTKSLRAGDGVTAELLKKNGIRVMGESGIADFLKECNTNGEEL
ncbi:MAG: DUF523 domain-containing protein [Oscillospiraceae bacterium]|nr:DUF523 domain-containing protein [Oscillospiraceae bacterium]